MDGKKGVKTDKSSKKGLDKQNSPIDENLQGQGIQVAPLTKKKSIKRTRIS